MKLTKTKLKQIIREVATEDDRPDIDDMADALFGLEDDITKHVDILVDLSSNTNAFGMEAKKIIKGSVQKNSKALIKDIKQLVKLFKKLNLVNF